MTTLYKIVRLLTVAATTLVVAACAPMKPANLIAKIVPYTPSSTSEDPLNTPLNQIEIKHVPFFPQDQLQCGPAAMATVLAYSGLQTSPSELSPEVFTPGKAGTLQIDIMAGFRRLGFLPYPVNTPEQIIASLKKNKPVLVFLNLAFEIAPMWHYAVVYGYKDGYFLLRSGTEKEEEIPTRTFKKIWQRGDNWGVIAFEPNQDLPPFVTPENWLQASINMEQVSPFDALQFHSTGLSYWPKDERFYFAVANGFYQQKQYQHAITLLTKAIELKPDFADAWNNLAELYAQTNQPKQARKAIEQAIALGGPRLENYLASQETIKNSKTKKN